MHSNLSWQCIKLHSNFEEAIENLELRNVERKILKENEVRVKIVASSINFYDLLMFVGKYQSSPKLPFTVGTEASGIIIELGKAVSHLSLNQEVMIQMEIGMMAEEVVVSSLFCIPKPKSFSYVEAAAFPVGFLTAYNGLVQRGNLKPGEFLLVTGAAGGMGSAAIQLGKLLGAKVIAAVSSDSKASYVRSLGAEHVICYGKEDIRQQVLNITDGRFVDVVFELVGGDIFDKCVKCVGDHGRLLVVGFASGKIPSIGANLPLIKGFSVVGVRSGESLRRHPELAMEIVQKLQEWEETGKLLQLRPHIEKVYDVKHVKEAFRVVAERRVLGKSVVQWIPDNQSSIQSKL